MISSVGHCGSIECIDAMDELRPCCKLGRSDAVEEDLVRVCPTESKFEWVLFCIDLSDSALSNAFVNFSRVANFSSVSFS
jgi:hypothetical protein